VLVVVVVAADVVVVVGGGGVAGRAILAIIMRLPHIVGVLVVATTTDRPANKVRVFMIIMVWGRRVRGNSGQLGHAKTPAVEDITKGMAFNIGDMYVTKCFSPGMRATYIDAVT